MQLSVSEIQCPSLQESHLSPWVNRLDVVEVSPGVCSLSGAVPGHQLRKEIYAQVAGQLEDELLNELELSAAGFVQDRQILKALKGNEHLAGIRFYLAEPAYKPLYSVQVQCDGGVVRLSGMVADATTKSYLETRVWVMPGVRRVISMVSVLDDKALRLDHVVRDLSGIFDTHWGLSDRLVGVDRLEHSGLSLVVSNKTTQSEQRIVEEAVWAIPEVRAVETRLAA